MGEGYPAVNEHNVFPVILIKKHLRKCINCDYFSDYITNNATINVNDPHYPGAEAGDGVKRAVWQLVLAVIFKAIITIFTFGIKVRDICGT